MNFNGQILAEKNSDGTWSDYIFANGKRIARADNYDIRIHMHGTTCSGSNCPANEFAAVTSLGAANGHVISAGDLLTWRQFQSGSVTGGMLVGFGPTSTLNGIAVDSDGQLIDADQTMNSWHERVVDLCEYACGQTVAGSIVPWKSPTSGPGDWDLYFADIVLVTANGTSIPLYNRSLGAVNSVVEPGITNYSGITEKVANQNPEQLSDELNSTIYYSADQIGSTSITTSGSGWPLSSDTYYPFGQEPTPPTDPNHYKFTGKERDAESGLDNLGARYYASTMGRFMSPDIVGGDLSNPQSLNRYAYVLNNPLGLIDPDGFQASCTSATILQTGDTATTCNQSAGTGTTPFTSGQAFGGRDVGLGDGEGPVDVDNSNLPALGGGTTDLAAALGVSGGTTGSVGLGVAQTGLDLAGMIPGPIGMGANIASAGISAYNGHYGAAALSLAFAVPIIGQFGSEAMEGYRSFNAFKRVAGAAGDFADWHHIVGQTPGNIARFGPGMIHDAENIRRGTKRPSLANHRPLQLGAFWNGANRS